jgi:hypothetical protein
MEQGKKYWFRARPPANGWGWGLPITWQGWVVFAGFFVLLIAGCVVLPQFGYAMGIALWSCGLASALIAICYWKGEPPGPFWGRDDPTRR